MKLSEIELDFLYEKSAELFRDKVKQRGEDYEHDNRCACPEAVRRTHIRTLARESIEDVKILIEVMVMKLNKMVFDDKKIEEAARRAADLYEQDLLMMSYDEDTEVDGQHHFCQEFGAELFKDGAKWAINEFLKNLWHLNTEEPDKSKSDIITLGFDNDAYLQFKESILWNEESWRHSISRCQIIKWAYLSDILPKHEGGNQ